LQALVFDSYFDQYRGVVSAIRVLNGNMSNKSRLRYMQAGDLHDIEEIGLKTPDLSPVAEITTGEVGYVIAGIKNIAEARSGETITDAARPATDPLAGYQE